MQSVEFRRAKGVLLWDIDGTLLQKNENSEDSIHLAALGLPKQAKIKKELSGLSDWEVLTSYGIEFGLTNDQILAGFTKLDYLQREKEINNLKFCPGIHHNFLKELSRDWIMGILTGNTAFRTTIKLKSVGIFNYFDLNYIFCCETGESREDIALRARPKISESSDLFIVIGDTPYDVKVARCLGAISVSVATGAFTHEDLLKQVPNFAIKNFKVDKEYFLEFLETLVST